MQNSAAAAEHAGEEDGSAAAAHADKDAETFDDGEFYAQLLKEFLEGSGGADAAAAGSAAALAKVLILAVLLLSKSSWMLLGHMSNATFLLHASATCCMLQRPHHVHEHDKGRAIGYTL